MCCGRYQACGALGQAVRVQESSYVFFTCSLQSPIHHGAHQWPQSVHQFTNSQRGASEAPSIHQLISSDRGLCVVSPNINTNMYLVGHTPRPGQARPSAVNPCPCSRRGMAQVLGCGMILPGGPWADINPHLKPPINQSTIHILTYNISIDPPIVRMVCLGVSGG